MQIYAAYGRDFKVYSTDYLLLAPVFVLENTILEVGVKGHECQKQKYNFLHNSVSPCDRRCRLYAWRETLRGASVML